MERTGYFLFDLRHEHLASPLLALRLRGGRYQPVPPARMPNGARGWYSETLELFFQPAGSKLRLYDPATGRYLLAREETEHVRRKAERARRRKALPAKRSKRGRRRCKR